MNKIDKEFKIAARRALCLIRRCIRRLPGEGLPALRGLMAGMLLLSQSGTGWAAVQTLNLINSDFSGGGNCNWCWCGEKGSATANEVMSYTYVPPLGAHARLTSLTMQVNKYYSCNGCGCGGMNWSFNGSNIFNINCYNNCGNAGASVNTLTITPAVFGGAGNKTISLVRGAGCNGSGMANQGTGGGGSGYQAILTMTYTDVVFGSTITQPAQASFVSTTTPTITWANSGATAYATYNLQISSEAFFIGSGLINKTGLAALTYKLNGSGNEALANGQGYYTRVICEAGGAQTSYINDFSVELSSPPAPTLTSPGTDYPAQPEVIGTQKPRFDWGTVTAPH